MRSAWLFAFGEILLYLALAQFLAGGLSKIANVLSMSAQYGSRNHQWFGWSIWLLVKLLPLPLWWTLVFVAPWIKVSRSSQKRLAGISYACTLTLMFLCSAVSFELKRDGNAGLVTFLLSWLKQTVQPVFW